MAFDALSVCGSSAQVPSPLLSMRVTYDSASFFNPGAREGAKLLAAVALLGNVTVPELISERRARLLVRLRQVAVYVLSTRGWSSPRIGRLLGNRDHSTILYNLSCAKDLYEKNAGFRAFCDSMLAGELQ